MPPTARRRSILPTRRQMLIGVPAAIALCFGLLALAYARTSIPEPNAIATAQTTVIYADDGKTQIARLGIDRTVVPLSAVPRMLQEAVLAAEDRHFYTEPAVSASGTLRALVTDVLGGDITQGGSTITQQYVKNAYLSPRRTLLRKLDEVLIALKLGQQRSKQQILADYLNTIYFGRGAFGVAAAARAYFRESLSSLTTSQDALLAAVIDAPSLFDPRVDKAASESRWQYVVHGLETMGVLSAGQAARLHFPKTAPPPRQTGCTGNACFISQAVQAQLVQMGFTQAQLSQGGYKVITTIDPKAQAAAEQAVHAAEQSGQLNEHTGSPEAAVVSIKPGNGAIEAMYAGPGCHHTKSPTGCIDTTGVTHLFDPSYLNYGRPPGSSMKPYTLVAALESGISLNQTFPGPPTTTVDGSTVSNAGGEACSSPCTLQTALAESINTVFVPLAAQVGPAKVAAVAHAAGIPKDVNLGGNYPEITLGNSDVPVVDQADGYATIAAEGLHARPYLVSKVIDAQGNVVARYTPKVDRAFSSAVASQAAYAMEQVLKCTPVQGTACGHALAGGRPAAGKTGTATNQANQNTDAWFIGFTPQLTTAVWVGNAHHGSVLSAGGLEIYGGQLPATIWQQDMDAALAGTPVVPFPPPEGIVAPSAPPTTAATSASPTTGSPSATTSTTAPTRTPTASPTPTPSSSSPSPTGVPTTSRTGTAGPSP